MNTIQTRTKRAGRAMRLALGCIGAVLALALVTGAQANASRSLRIAFGDIPGIEALGLLIALEQSRQRGVDIRVSYYDSEDVAAQAVLGGGADIGVGAPYGTFTQERPPIRLIYQLSRMHFVPVIDAGRYDSWADLHGEDVTVHSRGSATDAIARLLAARHDIEYGRIDYVAGSQVRAGAMLAGNMHATLVDTAGWRMLRERGKRFQRVSLDGLNATDEALYASDTVLREQAREVRILLEEILRTWRAINAAPEVAAQLREHYDLLPNLPADAKSTIVPYYRDAIAAGVLPENGGSPESVRGDLEVYLRAFVGRTPDRLDPAQLWDFGPVRAARERLD